MAVEVVVAEAADEAVSAIEVLVSQEKKRKALETLDRI